MNEEAVGGAFQDRPSKVTEAREFVKTDWKWMMVVGLCTAVFMFAVFSLVRRADKRAVERSRSETFTVTQGFIQADRDSMKAFIKRRDSVFRSLFPEVELPSLNWPDTAYMRREVEQKLKNGDEINRAKGDHL